ncbi:hypothetical protein [Nioella nitratireducens]|uniref:hypothetical protein n=1 Tax=Nioella nitratireducens TaxID=1287720 RepID=UPI0008FD4078|nr:hypothetical protein [Nioella nitratireducens]
MPLEVVGTEVAVESFSADILARKAVWPGMSRWMAENMQRLQTSFSRAILELNNLPTPDNGDQGSI